MTTRPTFVLEKIAHTSAAGEDELRDIFDDLGLLFGRESGEPLGQTLILFAISLQVGGQGAATRTYHFALPRQQDEVPGKC